jgi:hypothetical protein|tara:strand:- start:12432 stop:12536 length:105 start_codon:yes stop_codon:yes gene_type:complete
MNDKSDQEKIPGKKVHVRPLDKESEKEPHKFFIC